MKIRLSYVIGVILILNSALYAKDTITGIYTENVSPHEEVSTMMILPNNQFCFSFMGGDLDMLMAGTWTTQKNQIIFREQREIKDHFDASAHLDTNIEGKKIILNGISFSRARNTIFTIADRATTPEKFTLLFETGYNEWESSYEISIEQEQNKSIFIAKALKIIDDDPKQKKMLYKVYEYTLDYPNKNVIYLSFDRDSDRKNFNVAGVVSKKAISFHEGESKLKKIEELTPSTIAQIQERCVAPRFNQKQYTHKGAIVPLRSYEITLPIPNEHHFASTQIPQSLSEDTNKVEEDAQTVAKYYGFINTKGEMAIPPKFKDVGDFGPNGLAPFKSGEEYGYINTKGEVVIKPQFDSAFEFTQHGLASVAQGCYTSHEEVFLDNQKKKVTRMVTHEPYCKYGYINTSGEVVIKPQFDQSTSFYDNGLAIIKIGQKYGIINTKGNIIAQPIYDDISYQESSNLFSIWSQHKEGLMNIYGKIITPMQYDSIDAFDTQGIAQVKQNNKHGLIDRSGKLIYPLQSEFINMTNGYVEFEKSGKMGFKNAMAQVIVEPIYDAVESFGTNGYAEVKKGGKWGYVNTKGMVVIPFVYESTSRFSENNITAVKLNHQWHFINQKGEILHTPEISDTYGFSKNGLAAVLKDGKWGFMNAKGDMIIPNTFEDVYGGFGSNSFAQIQLNGKWQFINTKGEFLTQPTDYEANVYIPVENAPKRAVIGEKLLYISPDGELNTKMSFDHIGDEIHNDLILVRIDDKFGFINTKGEMVIKPNYSNVSNFSNGFARLYQ